MRSKNNTRLIHDNEILKNTDVLSLHVLLLNTLDIFDFKENKIMVQNKRKENEVNGLYKE